MKYYIATKLERYADHNAVRDAMATLGHEITYDWTHHGSVKDQGHARIAEVAELEATGVRDAEFVIVLLPGGRGTHAELGMAIGWGVPILLHSADGAEFAAGAATCAFYHHPLVRQVVGGRLADLPRSLPNCRACAHCFLEPDDDFCCGHPDAGPVGTYIKHAAREGGHCGPRLPKFEQHPARTTSGDLRG